jgi:hypothetical protein
MKPEIRVTPTRPVESEVAMQIRSRLLVVSLMLALMVPAVATAEIVWPTAMAFRVDTGVETPLVLFGFNPQPEPPPALATNRFFDPETAVQELSGIDPTPFQLYLASEDGAFSVPSEPVVDFDTIEIPFTTNGGVDLTFLVRFSPRGDGDASTGISDPLFFNPQPEPPPQLASIGFLFAFEGVAAGDDVSTSLQVLDEGMQPIAMTPVAQVPATGMSGSLVLTAVVGATGMLAALRSRTSRSASRGR